MNKLRNQLSILEAEEDLALFFVYVDFYGFLLLTKKAILRGNYRDFVSKAKIFRKSILFLVFESGQTIAPPSNVLNTLVA